ncbi:3-phosphoshikimate 1-carboxyvinyltransferase [Candidatus Gottesmanbacteria bacterium CG11_big_fil_rev_8_21_14_0_20_37_11]|uniref:3-phosphoshikimate 1-carboxyvinyltransferase n=2 Tax=Candidatus Gottesmaniibacteriota TaxID=1752720 RepID=A0A2M7RPZ1_9BACT|nr:MAG: 3-phosphoshikimate 1-carboxyvinyltransferase [Candidatus Gottesmanbacteria bacterium CG23_combo_of_CG06-09_8_20_14_all_37_19]PIR08834.1 MAG: 3-phosphoshikimate 1-carboxyvinyltransferase [Candidatus Gottesmanbacteria bacterium CG11_big_fil_rev_8_21_14_0_20_37_11]PIZ02332.1 MAG: 3-phosphoshikimate 1-carboxyvinyltransferase [Candidatus Gottesmanbacteria bacterium CG_4_10_14_0_8_um_filter_37_24]
MKVIIHPSQVYGNIIAPPSKSITHRAIILSSLAQGQSVLENCLICKDTLYTLSSVKKFGIKTVIRKNKIIVNGNMGIFCKKSKLIKLYLGNSGTTLRFMTAYACLTKNKVLIDGHSRLRERPVEELVIALRKLGSKIVFLGRRKTLPILIKQGNFHGGKISIPGVKSSQFISALLMIAPYSSTDVTINLDDVSSRPYVDLTTGIMKKFGAKIVQSDDRCFLVNANRYYKAVDFKVEGDYSSSSYLMAAAAIKRSKISIAGLNPKSKQGDKFFLKILNKMGVQTSWSNQILTVSAKNNLKAISLSMKDYPDIVPTLSIIASCAKGITRISDIGHLRHKESDRLLAIASQLKKMNINVKISKDNMEIEGGTPQGAAICSFDDHRIIMSFSILGLAAQGNTTIQNSETVNKSYPSFFTDLKDLKANLEIIK